MLKQDLLKYLGLLATTWISRDATLQLERVPAGIVIETVSQSRRAFDEPERIDLYRLLAQDERSEVRDYLKRWLIDDKHLSDLRKLAEDTDPRVQALTAEILRAKLFRAHPDDQTAWATLFALALEPGPRLTLAKALDGNVPGEADYLYVLANDGDVSIRQKALDTTLRRVDRSPQLELREGFLDIFESRLHDPVRTVRKKARRGFVRARA